MFLWKVY